MTDPQHIEDILKMTSKVRIPTFDGEKRYERYIQEVDAWCAVEHTVAKKDKAVVLALSLPDGV